MKKVTLLPILAVVLLSYFACRKSDTQYLSEKLKDPFVREAAIYIKSQISDAEFESLDIENYSSFRRGKTEVIGVRFTVKDSD